MYIEPAQLNGDEKKMAQLLGGMEGQTSVFDFSVDDKVQQPDNNYLEAGGWTVGGIYAGQSASG